jgi:hypothetical protein
MELPGAAYLYTLATLAIAIVGFSGIILVLVQSFRGDQSDLHKLRARILIEAGLTAAGGAMLPPLVGLSGLPTETVWRISSGIAAPILFVWAIMYPVRRRRVSPGPIPVDVWIGVSGRVLTAIGVLFNAIGRPFEPGPFLYSIAVTWVLITACIILVRAVTQSLPTATLQDVSKS